MISRLFDSGYAQKSKTQQNRNNVSKSLCGSINLFVAESSPITAQLLAEAIAKHPGLDVVGFSSNPAEVMRILHASHVDVLLVSARMEEEPYRGIALLRQLRSERPGLKAIVLLDSSRQREVVEAFRAGACGVFCRSKEIKMLRKCIAAVHRGQVWASSEELGFVLWALTAVQPLQFDSKRLLSLSTREKDVVRCIAEGLTNSEIAKTLEISQHTVKNYVFKIFDKLGVSNRVELVFHVLSAPATLGFAPLREKNEISSSQDQQHYSPASCPL
jgi:DNA-binding NarL/FixJ family response regulator